jgi:hypothetical protein
MYNVHLLDGFRYNISGPQAVSVSVVGIKSIAYEKVYLKEFLELGSNFIGLNKKFMIK